MNKFKMYFNCCKEAMVKIKRNSFFRGPQSLSIATTISLTLALHMETGDSVFGQFVLVEGYAASILPRKNPQLKTTFLD